MTKEPTLAEKMRALAGGDHPRGPELIEKANALDVASAHFGEKGHTADDAKRLLGCWARARRLWCDITGEPLI
jgi:hypothetical protein